MKGLIIPAEFVANWNNAKPCHYCKGICEKMYKNTGFEPMCRPCAEENVKDNPDYLKGTDFVTDARFKCLAKACNATGLVFKEFVIGSCCYKAFLKATEEYPTTKIEKDVYRVLTVAKGFFNASIGRQQDTLGKMLQQK
ncbi:Oidioi.mRNA.OKI2018_I69.PAR.g12224.t1.cds [Oikopleura dioica]|uniref:Oidioi.mRNA.OKI2018_I69.PAR.g12224.t1.cds n=1 Tax=Oikopleura dioica TaxID=34765 RepID=A0ABN7S2Y1_OIKDI|nr:Oidioi.mRNA.OKI2018_I69.PAR.g12224.t1.cds [Oikopleura dioica]